MTTGCDVYEEATDRSKIPSGCMLIDESDIDYKKLYEWMIKNAHKGLCPPDEYNDIDGETLCAKDGKDQCIKNNCWHNAAMIATRQEEEGT